MLVLTILATALVLASTVPAAARQEASTNSDSLPLPADQELVWKVVGRGVQIYDCQPTAADPTVNV